MSEAQPKTLYVRRPVINAGAVIEWARAAGFKSTLPESDLHVTVAFSKVPVDWTRFAPNDDDLANEAGADGRDVERLGQDGEAVVLRFSSPALAARWREFTEGGASWDWPEYKPHMTISYDAGDIDISQVVPFADEIQLGPEVFEEVKSNWQDNVKEIATDSALRLALDRDSVREKRRDGQLVVKRAHITKANVCPYRGAEIPGFAELGLDPDKIYNLLRDPDELKKAAPTLNGVQLLRKHVPVNAEDHQPYDTVGSLGTDAEFVDDDGENYLDNSLFINASDAIEGVESGKKRELSAGYHYVPDMTPGNFRGTAFDGVMRDIVFNHVALVEDGRAGPDVVVGDSMENLMSKPTKLAVALNHRVAASLAPLIAMDSKVTLPKELFASITTKNFKESTAKMLAGVKLALDGKTRKGLAMDGPLEHLKAAVDAYEELAGPKADEPAGEEKEKTIVDTVEPISGEIEGKTFDGGGEIGQFLRGKGMGEDDIKTVCDMMPKPGAMDSETDEEKAAREKKEAEAKTAKDNEMDDTVSKQAMDSALKAQSDHFSKELKTVRDNERGVRAALNEVRAYVGELPASMAFDSAPDVYRHALVMKGVDGAKAMHADALLPVLKTLPKIGDKQREIAMDAAPSSGAFAKATEIAPGLAGISAI